MISRYVSHPVSTLFPCPFFSGCPQGERNRYIKQKNTKKEKQKPNPLIKTISSYPKQRNPIVIAHTLLSWFLFSPKMWLKLPSGPLSLSPLLFSALPFFSPQEKAAASRSQQMKVI